MISDQPGYLQGELIFSTDTRPTPQSHASTIAAVSDKLMVAWFGGSYEKHPDVGIWLSTFSSDVWSQPVEVANGYQLSGSQYPCWNPVLFQPADGPLLLFYKVGPSVLEWWGMLMTSDDQGLAWSKPVRLPNGILGPIKNKPIRLNDGTLVCPSSTENEGWQVHIERTKDFGKTWNYTEPLKDEDNLGAIQPCILIHKNGQLQILCRTQTGIIAQSWSDDGGKSWNPLTSTGLPNPNSGIDALTLYDKRHLLVYNHVGKETKQWGGPRTPLNVSISDDGITWRPVIILEDQPGEFSYPAVIQTADSLVHITYTFRRTSIKHVVLQPSLF